MIYPNAFVHDKALVNESVAMGSGTRVWDFTHLLNGARIGADCSICEQVFIEGDVVMGNRVAVKCDEQLSDDLRVEFDVLIRPNAILPMTNTL